MENERKETVFRTDPDVSGRIQAELNELDRDLVDVDGLRLKPSQCYHFDINPTHVLFNTNCPDSVKEKVHAILSKYIPHYAYPSK
jgi:hypothetical protein